MRASFLEFSRQTRMPTECDKLAGKLARCLANIKIIKTT